MTSKHQSPEYQRNARTIRARVRSQHKHGFPSQCWRGGGAILPGVQFDVGHIDPQGGDHMTNLAPEHRNRTAGCCAGNRAIGGAQGAAITNSRRATQRVSDVSTWAV